MNLLFRKASKSQSLLRAAMFGPSGAGKTFTALRIATGIIEATGGRIAVVDTERGSASKYADRFDFDVLELPAKDINTYVAAIEAASEYKVLVIDSLSHAWQDLLEEIDQLAKAKFRGNTWSAWSEGTPKQRALVDAILNFPGHIIGTMRSKTVWETSQDERGKNRPTRVGLAPEQGKGIEYEFDILFEISTDHIANIIKDRTGRYQDKLIDKPGEAFGKELAGWLMDGKPAPDPMADPQTARRAIADMMNARNWSRDAMAETTQDWLKQLDVESFEETTVDQRKAFLVDIEHGRWDPPAPGNAPATGSPDPAAGNDAQPPEAPQNGQGKFDTAQAIDYLSKARTLDELAMEYRAAYLRAKQAGDEEALDTLKTFKDARKAELQGDDIPEEAPF